MTTQHALLSHATVLIVDDETNLRQTLAEIFQHHGATVVQTANGADALSALTRGKPDIIFCDWNMPLMSGEEVLRYIRERSELSDIPIIVITAYGTSDNAIGAVQLGAYDFVTKPFDLHDIVLTAERALEHVRLHRELARLRDAVTTRPEKALASGMAGSTQAMLEVFKLVGRVASSDSTVLVRGESGTGKELIARAIHDHSARARGPFIAVNCAAIPEALLESELFGHEKGAFTGAVARKPGRFELARGGTLFLDEIGDLPLAMQAKLLRVLQERRYERVGGTETLTADVRIIAATNRDLESAVQQEGFRSDLYYRLNVVSITLPPLRERRADIVPLAEHFLARQAARTGAAVAGLAEDAVLALQQYDFPGNVRELENIIERAVLLAGGRVITRVQLVFSPTTATTGDGSPDVLPAWLSALTLHEAVGAVERALIVAVLRDCGGNKTDAARRLGIQRRLLYAKMAEWKLDGNVDTPAQKSSSEPITRS